MVKNLPSVERSQKIRLGKFTPDVQATDTIVINATSDDITTANSGLYVAPIRLDPTAGQGGSAVGIGYNPTTKEIVQASFPVNQTQGLQEVTSNGAVTTLGVEVSNTLTATRVQVGFGATADDVNVFVVRGGVLIEGNLVATGDTTFVRSNNVSITDPLLELGGNNNSEAYVYDVGIIMNRPGENVGFAYLENRDELTIALTSNTATDRFVVPSSNLLTMNVVGDVYANAYFGEGSTLTNVAHLDDFLSNVTRIGDLETELTSNASRVTYLENVHASNAQRLSTLEQYHDDNVIRLNLLYNLQASNAAFLNTLASYHSSNVTRISNLETWLDDNSVRITNLSSNLADNSARISLLNTWLQDNSFRITTNSDNLSSNHYRLTNVESNLIANSNRITNLSLDVYAIDGRVTVLESETSNLRADLTSNVTILNATIDELDSNASRVTSLELLKAPIDNPVFTGIITGDGAGISNVDLQHVTSDGNATTNTVRFTSPTVAFVTDSTVGIANDDPDTNYTLHASGDIKVDSNVEATTFIAPGTHINLDGTNKFTGNTSVYGNLNVFGNVTYLDTENVYVKDPILGIGNPGSQDTSVIAMCGGPGANVAFGYNTTDGEFIIAYTNDGPHGVTLTPDPSRELNVHVYGTIFTSNGFGVANTNPVSDTYAISVGQNVFVTHSGDVVAIRSLADTGIFTSNVTTPKIESTGTNLEITAPNTVFMGNLDVRGATTMVSTTDLIVNDTVIDLANNNTLTSVDLGIRMKRPGANVIMAYQATSEELAFAHSVTGVTPDTTRTMNVHVYGNLDVDHGINVGSNVIMNDLASNVIDVDGSIAASIYYGDGGLLSNITQTLQGISEIGANTDQTIYFTNVTTGVNVTTSNIEVGGYYFGDGQFMSNVANLVILQSNVSIVESDLRSDLQSNVTILNQNIASNVSDVRSDLQSNVTILRTDLQSNVGILNQNIASNVSDVRSDLQSNVTILNQNIASNVSDVRSDLQSNVAILRTDLQSNVSILNQNIASNVSDLRTDVQSNVTILNQNIASNVSDLRSDLQSNVTILNQNIASNVSDVRSDLQSNVTILNQNIASNVSDVRSDLQSNVTILRTDLQSNVTILNQNIASNVSDLRTDVQSNVTILNQNIASNVSDVRSDLQSNVTILNQNIASNVSDVRSDLQSNVSILRTDLQSNVSILNQNIASNVSDVRSDLQSNVTILNQNIASNVSDLRSDLQSNVTILRTDLQSNVTILNQNIASNVSDVRSDLQSNVTILNQNIASNVSDVRSDLQSNVTILNQNIASNVSDLRSDLQSNVSILRTDLQSNVSILNQNIASNVSDLRSDLQSNVTILNQNIASNVSDLRSDLQSNVTILNQNIASNVADIRVDIASNVSIINSNVDLKADILDPTFSSNITVSNNLIMSDLTSTRVVFVGADKQLTDAAALTFESSTLTVDGDVSVSGNLTVEGAVVQLSTVNTIVNDALIEIGNNNTSDTLDLGWIMSRPSTSVAVGYRGDESELMLGHTLSDPSSTDLVPDASNALTVHVYGTLEVDTSIDVGANIAISDIASNVIDVTGSVAASMFLGDGQYLTNVANLAILQSNVSILNQNIASNVSDLRTDLQSNVTILNQNIASNVSDLRTDLQSNVTILNQNIASNVSDLRTDLQSNVSILNQNIASNVSDLRTDLQSNVTILNQNIASNVSDLRTDLQSNVSILNQNIASNVSDLRTDLQSNVTILNQNIASNVSDLRTDLQSNVTILNQNIASNVSDLRTDLQSNVLILNQNITSNVSDLRADIASNVAFINSNVDLKANILDPTFSSNVTVSNNLVVSDLTTTRVVFVGADKQLTDSSTLIFNSDTLTVDGNVVVDAISIGRPSVTGSNVLDVNGSANALVYYGDGGLLSNIRTDFESVIIEGNTTSNVVEFMNATTAFITDLTSNVVMNINQLNNVTITTAELVDQQQLRYDAGNGQWVNENSDNMFIKVYNGTGSEIDKGKVLYFFDSHNTNVANVALAKADSSATMPAIGIARDAIASGTEGYAITYGKVNGLNTFGFQEGGTVFVSNVVAGGLSNVKPYSTIGVDQIQNVGICVRAHGSNGVVFVTGIGRSNDIPNANVVTSNGQLTHVYVNQTDNDMKKIAPTNLLTKLQTLTQVVDTGNVTSNVVQFTNATTGLVATSNVQAGAFYGEGSTLSFTSNVFIEEGLVVNKNSVASKQYAHTGSMTFSNVGVTFSTNVFSAKITAHLIHDDDEVSTLQIDCCGGSKNGTSAHNIIAGKVNKFGVATSYPWNHEVVTTPTQIIWEPEQTGLTNYDYDIHVELLSSHPSAGVTEITEAGSAVKYFSY